MKIFLAPRSNETSYKNFLSTIENGVDYSTVEPYLDAVGKKILSSTGKLFVWGNKESKKTSWGKMGRGDYVLFYKNKKFIYYGKVAYTQLSENLALALWPAKKNQKPWSCIFFLQNIEKIDLPLLDINKLSDGKYKMDRVQGFMPLNSKVTDVIEQKFGSIENFLKGYPGKLEERQIKKEIFSGTRSIKKDALNFEKQIKGLLTKLEFNDVEGARDNFLINGIQVDVCGGWENTLLVIECKSKQEMMIANLRSAIHEFRGKIELLKRGFSEHPNYKKYSHLQFIIVTKNTVVRQVDIDLAIERPRIYIWDDEFLEYYSNLYSFIKPYAKYDLLGEMHVLPLYSKPIRVPAFRTTQKGKVAYNFLIDPRELLEVSYVARRNIRGERYYQRIIDERRLKKISEYIKSGGTFPNNIVVAFRPDLQVGFKVSGKFGNSTEFGMLEFPKDYCSCWIIDGQHRLYSFASLKDFYCNVSVTAFENLEINEQRKFFLDINRNQKAVDSDLLWDLSGDVVSEKEGVISNIAKQLNIDNSSPIWRGIYYPSAGIRDKNEKIKISAICVSIKKNRIAEELLSQNTRNPLYSKNSEEQIRKTSSFLISFLNTCKKLFPRNWEQKKNGFVLTNGGIAVMLGLFEKIMVRASQRNNTIANEIIFEEYLKPLQKRLEIVDSTQLKKMRLNTTSEGGKSDLLNELVLQIRTETGDNAFGGEIKSSQMEKEFRELEEKLKKLIYTKLFDPENEDWFKSITDPYTYDTALRNAKKQGKADSGDLYLQVGLGECIGIMRKNKDIFYPIFIDEEKELGFGNERMLEAALTTISEMRNRFIIHYTGAKKKQSDEIIVKMYLDKMNSCINDELENSKD